MNMGLIRPSPREAFLTLTFAPGEAARADWGEFSNDRRWQ